MIRPATTADNHCRRHRAEDQFEPQRFKGTVQGQMANAQLHRGDVWRLGWGQCRR